MLEVCEACVSNSRFRLANALLLLFLASTVVCQSSSGSGCALSDDEKRGLVRTDNATWLVTNNAYEAHGIQKIFDCAHEGDVVLLESTLRIRPSRRIVIRRSLTVDGAPSLNGSRPAGKAEFSCPRREGLFLVSDGSFTLKNVAVKKCKLSKRDRVAGIIETDTCRRHSSANHEMHLIDVLFERNENRGGSAGLFVRDSSCYIRVELLKVTFDQNRYYSSSSLSLDNSLTNVQVIANRGTRIEDRKVSFFHFPKNSTTTVTNLMAKKNKKATVLNVYRGELSIFDSLFEKNVGDYREVVRALASFLTVHRSRFLNNSCDFCSGTALRVRGGLLIDISFCEFSGNKATFYQGTVSVSYPREIAFTSCNFTENMVALSFDGADVDSPRNDENKYPTGKRMSKSVSFIDCRFLKNRGFDGASVRFSSFYSQTVLFESCHFLSNTVPDMSICSTPCIQGAVVLDYCYVEDFASKNCRFKNNRGMEGASLHFYQSNGTFRVLENAFHGNRAVVGGSSVLVHSNGNGDALPNTKLIIERSVFEGNAGRRLGGTLHVTGKQADVELLDSVFVKNVGQTGAAVIVEGAYSLDIESCRFEENIARKDGGAIHLEETKAQVGNSSFVKNKGQYGGAIESLADLTATDCNFSANEATGRGGALHVNCQSSVPFNEACFTQLHRCRFVDNRADRSGGAVHVYAKDELLIADAVFHKNNATFGGGLSFFRAVKDGLWTVANSNFSENRASTGGKCTKLSRRYEQFLAIGALSLMDIRQTEGVVAEAGNVFSIFIDRAPGLVFRNTFVWNNTARFSGAGIYLEKASLLKIDGMSAQTLKKTVDCQGTERPADNQFETHIYNNTVDRGYEENLASLSAGVFNNTVDRGYQENLASLSAGFCVAVIKDGNLVETVSQGQTYTLREWRSGDDFPVMGIVMRDQFGKSFSRTIDQELKKRTSSDLLEEVYEQSVSAVLSSKAENLTQHLVQNRVYEDVSSGGGNILIGNPSAYPGIYQLTLHVEGFEKPITIEVHVRNCTINEQSDRNGTLCRPCESNQYNFHAQDPEEKCKQCPEFADCSTDFTFPRTSYWNSFPCSDQMDRCAYEEACIFAAFDLWEEPATDLESKCQFNESSIAKYQLSQCAREYTGPLCSSCTNATGRLGSFACATCISEPLVAIGLIGILAFQLLLALLAIRETLNADSGHLENRIATLSFVRRTRKATRQRGKYDSFRRAPKNTPASRRIDALPRLSINSNVQKVKKAKWRFLGVLKITVNLLQTIGVAISLDVSWNITTLALFKTWDALGGAAFIGASFFLDCLLPHGGGVPRTVMRQAIIAFSPELIALVFTLFSLLNELRSDRDWARFLRRAILAHVVVAYNSYLTLVKVAIDVFNCVHIHDGTTLETVKTTRNYWIMDTSVRCYRGSHLNLMLPISILLMLLVVGFPLMLIICLSKARKHGSLSSTWTQETMGFLFTVFEEELVYWDSLILVRKAFLSVIVVFGYRLGGYLQGHLALAALVISLFLQQYYNPFKRELGNLNFLESMSLLMSFFTFLCGLMLSSRKLDSPIPNGILTAVLVIGNAGLFAALIFFLAQVKLEQMRLELELAEIDCGNGSFFRVILAYLEYQFTRLRGTSKKDSDDSASQRSSSQVVELSTSEAVT